MDKVSVRAVHRVPLGTDGYGGITFSVLDGPVRPFPDGAAVVLDCGDGWWTRLSELERILPALSGVGHITITGQFVDRKGAAAPYGLICGLEAIAERLGYLLANPPMFTAS